MSDFAPTKTHNLQHEIVTDRNVKLAIVKNFIKQNCNLAPQGSAEWLKTRQSIVGGSELSVLIGKNPFTNVADLVANKCNLTSFSGNMATRWGNVFEELTRIIVHMVFLFDIPLNEECIFETGSLEGVIPHHRFSPDGLTVLMSKTNSGKFIEALIALLEFKSPLSSIPSGTIPPYYLPQVKAGMCDIEMSEIGLFVNNMFRKCSLAQLGNNNQYNTSFHFSDIKKKIIVQDPYAIGIIGLYQTQEQLKNTIALRAYERSKFQHGLPHRRRSRSDLDSSEYRSDTDEDTVEDDVDTLDWQIINNVIDVGALDENDTLKIFQLIMSKHITVKHYAPNIYMNRLKKNIPNELVCVENDIISYKSYENSPQKFVDAFAKKCTEAGHNPVGYIPWKLFIADFILVDKDPLYIYQFVPKIEEVIGIVTELCKIDDIGARRIKYQEYYPATNSFKFRSK